MPKMPKIAQELVDAFGIDEEDAGALWSQMRTASDGDEVDAVLNAVNETIDGYGIEPIRGDYHVDNYYYDVVALYVNMGDTYNTTVLYETETDRWRVTTFGDWVERNERRYGIV